MNKLNEKRRQINHARIYGGADEVGRSISRFQREELLIDIRNALNPDHEDGITTSAAPAQDAEILLRRILSLLEDSE